MRQAARVFLIIVFGVFLSTVLVSLWLGEGQLILGHDSGYRLIIGEFWLSLFSAWAPVLNFGSSTPFNPAVVPIHLPEVFVSLMTQDPVLTQRLVLIYWHTVNLFALSVAFFIARIPLVSGWWILVLGSLLYAVNFLNLHAWSVIWRAKFTTQFLLAIIVFYLYGTLRKGFVEGRKLVIVALLSALFNSGGSPPLFGPLLVAWITTGLYGVSVAKNRKKAVFLFMEITGKLFFLFSVFSAYWLIPYISYAFGAYGRELAAQGGVAGILGIVDAVSKNASLVNIFRMQGLPAWDSNSQFPFMLTYIENPVFVIASFVWPILALGAYFSSRNGEEKRTVGLFFILLVVGMFFTAGSHPPTGEVFNFLVQAVPGFGIFRTAFYKFGIIPWFAISVLAAMTMVRCSQFIATKIRHRFTFPVVMGIWMVFILWYHLPFLAGNFFDYNRPFTNKVILPEYVHQTASYIHATTEFEDAILLLPRLENNNMDGYAWGYWSPDPLPRMVLHRPIVSDANSPPDIVDGVYDALNEGRMGDFIQILRRAGIRTLLWRDDVLYSDKVTGGYSFRQLEESLKEDPDIELSAAFGAWRVYTVRSVPRRKLFSAHTSFVTSTAPYGHGITLPGSLDSSLLIYPDKEGSRGKIYAAECFLCNPHIRKKLESSYAFEPVVLMPDSRLFFIVTWLEQKAASAPALSENQRIDLYVSFMRKRLSEINAYMAKEDPRVSFAADLAVSAIYQYADEIRTALGRLSDFEAETKKEELFFIFDGFGGAVKALESINSRSVDLRPLADVFAQQQDGLMMSKTFAPGTNGSFLVEVPQDDMYEIIVRNRQGERIPFSLDGQRLPSATVKLLKGVHRIETGDLDARVYAQTDMRTSPNNRPPQVTYTSVDMTRFRVRIANATGPYILHFNQAFDPLWKAYIVKKDGPRRVFPSEDNHIHTNGYANGWLITKTGDYDVLVEYAPQKLIETGLLVSAVSFVFALVYLSRKETNA